MFPVSEAPKIIFMISESLDGLRAKVCYSERVYDRKSKKKKTRDIQYL